MKPVGLTDPKTGRWPYAVRAAPPGEPPCRQSYNLVGFQNHLKYSSEQSVSSASSPALRTPPSSATARSTATPTSTPPRLLTETLQLKRPSRTSSSPASSPASKATPSPSPPACSPAATPQIFSPDGHTLRARPPSLSANGSLTHYITHCRRSNASQPANITFDLLPPLEEDLRKRIRDKKERHRIQCERALEAWRNWLPAGLPTPPPPQPPAAATTPERPSPSPRSPAAPPPPHAPLAAPPAI